MLTTSEGYTDMPLVLLGYSVGVLGSNMQHTAVNLLGTIEQLECYTVVIL